jgi:hypothetical protein
VLDGVGLDELLGRDDRGISALNAGPKKASPAP